MMKPVFLQLASNFMSGSFPETTRINVSDAVIQRYRKSLNQEM